MDNNETLESRRITPVECRDPYETGCNFIGGIVPCYIIGEDEELDRYTFEIGYVETSTCLEFEDHRIRLSITSPYDLLGDPLESDERTGVALSVHDAKRLIKALKESIKWANIAQRKDIETREEAFRKDPDGEIKRMLKSAPKKKLPLHVEAP